MPADASVDRAAAAAAGGVAATTDSADVITVDEAARWLRVDRKTLYDAAARRAIPCARLGRRVLLSRAALTAWLAGGAS